MNTATESKPLSLRTKLLFSTGDLGVSMPMAILTFFQLYFLTDVAGLRPDYAAWAVAASRLWDAINDPLFGVLSDRIRTRWGRRRVLLLFGAVPLGISYMLIWIVPTFDQIMLAVYYAIVFILFDTAYTTVHVGYNALTPELTSDYDERSSINGYRMVFSIVGTLSAIILATVLGWSISDKQLLYKMLGFGLGLIAIIPPFIVFGITSEKPADELPEALPLKASIKLTMGNHPFRMIMGLYLLSWTTASIIAAVLVYFANYYMRVPDQANYFVLAAQGSAIAFIPVVVKLSKILDKRRAFIIGSASWMLIMLAISIIRADQIALAYILAVLAGFGIATAYVVPWAMIPDVIENDELESGQRREGSYYAFAAFFQKLATGFALWGMGQALSMTGYITPTQANPLPVQPQDAVNAIRFFAGPVPAILLLLAILFAWQYSITREDHQVTLQLLAERES